MNGPADTRSRRFPFVLTLAVLIMAAVAAAIWMRSPATAALVTVRNTATYDPQTLYVAPKVRAFSPTKQKKAPPAVEHNLYVVVTAEITNRLSIPIFIESPTATITTAAGDTYEPNVVHSTEMPNLETMFPALTPLIATPFIDAEQLAPHATRTASFILFLPTMTEADWKQRKDAAVTVHLAHQPPVTVSLAH